MVAVPARGAEDLDVRAGFDDDALAERNDLAADAEEDVLGRLRLSTLLGSGRDDPVLLLDDERVVGVADVRVAREDDVELTVGDIGGGVDHLAGAEVPLGPVVGPQEDVLPGEDVLVRSVRDDMVAGAVGVAPAEEGIEVAGNLDGGHGSVPLAHGSQEEGADGLCRVRRGGHVTLVHQAHEDGLRRVAREGPLVLPDDVGRDLLGATAVARDLVALDGSPEADGVFPRGNREAHLGDDTLLVGGHFDDVVPVLGDHLLREVTGEDARDAEVRLRVVFPAVLVALLGVPGLAEQAVLERELALLRAAGSVLVEGELGLHPADVEGLVLVVDEDEGDVGVLLLLRLRRRAEEEAEAEEETEDAERTENVHVAMLLTFGVATAQPSIK